MKTKLLTLALLALSASAQTFTCSGCTDYGQIGTTGYTMQYGSKMVFTANVEPGSYVVSLTFVEPVYTTKGARPINAWVNDVQLLGAFDIIASVKQFAPITWRTQAVDSGGKITVVLTANDTGTTKHNAIISAISASKISGGATPPTAFLVTSVPLAMQMDGTAILAVVGSVVSGSVSVFRNGVLQGNKDLDVDTNDPTKIKVSIKVLPVDPGDDWAVSYQRQ